MKFKKMTKLLTAITLSAAMTLTLVPAAVVMAETTGGEETVEMPESSGDEEEAAYVQEPESTEPEISPASVTKEELLAEIEEYCNSAKETVWALKYLEFTETTDGRVVYQNAIEAKHTEYADAINASEDESAWSTYVSECKTAIDNLIADAEEESRTGAIESLSGEVEWLASMRKEVINQDIRNLSDDNRSRLLAIIDMSKEDALNDLKDAEDAASAETIYNEYDKDISNTISIMVAVSFANTNIDNAVAEAQEKIDLLGDEVKSEYSVLLAQAASEGKAAVGQVLYGSYDSYEAVIQAITAAAQGVVNEETGSVALIVVDAEAEEIVNKYLRSAPGEPIYTEITVENIEQIFEGFYMDWFDKCLDYDLELTSIGIAVNKIIAEEAGAAGIYEFTDYEQMISDFGNEYSEAFIEEHLTLEDGTVVVEANEDTYAVILAAEAQWNALPEYLQDNIDYILCNVYAEDYGVEFKPYATLLEEAKAIAASSETTDDTTTADTTNAGSATAATVSSTATASTVSTTSAATNDSADIALWISILGIAGIAAGGTAVVSRRRDK